MRVSKWGKRPSYHQVLKKKVTREIEDRGQLLVLAVFLLLLALSTPEQAGSWLVGGITALVSFHASIRAIDQAEGLEKKKGEPVRRRSFRRRVLFVTAIMAAGLVIQPLDFTTLVTAIFTTKLALYFLAPTRSSLRTSS